MSYYLLCFLVFLTAFTINMTYITVFYHRALTHGAVRLKPWALRFVTKTGIWMTGLDPKTWACMHRLHHRHSDTARDPHSPATYGVFGVMKAQLRSYEKTWAALLAGDHAYSSVVSDLRFPVHGLVKRRLWLLPYLLHATLALAFAATTGAWLMGVAYWVGMLSHPAQGWMVNALAHKYGYRNFTTSDDSRNNTWVAWLAMGEGYQNNHHRHPHEARFSWRWWEVDLGYGLCLVARSLGMITIPAGLQRRQAAPARQTFEPSHAS